MAFTSDQQWEAGVGSRLPHAVYSDCFTTQHDNGWMVPRIRVQGAQFLDIVINNQLQYN